jgi:GAF domain-containing protein
VQRSVAGPGVGVVDAPRMLEFLGRANDALARSLHYEETLHHVAGLAVPEIADWCAVDVLEPDGELRQITSGHPDAEQEAFLLELRRRYRAEKGTSEGVSRVIRTGEAELASDVSAGPIVDLHLDAVELERYQRLAPRSYIIVPLVSRGVILGALTLLSCVEGRHYGSGDLEFAHHLARRFAAAVDHARLYEQAERGRERLDFLARASDLLNRSLDLDETLERLAFLVVPRMADWCTIDLAESDGSIRNLAVAHADPLKIELARNLQEHYPVDPTAATGVPNVLRTGRAELYTEIPDELLVEGAQNAEHLELIRQLGLVSVMTVPLNAQGRVFGAITLCAAESGRRYGARDLTFAEDLGRRAATAIENARLFHRQETLARESREMVALLLREATEINDNVIQALVLAKYAHEAGDAERAAEALDRTLAEARRIVEELQAAVGTRPGDLRRSGPAA